MKNKKQIFIYPVYFDVSRSRGQGRRVPRKLAVQTPSINELGQIVSTLGLTAETNLEAKYPRFHWVPSGLLLIKRQEDLNKNAVIRKIAVQLKKSRTK